MRGAGPNARSAPREPIRIACPNHARPITATRNAGRASIPAKVIAARAAPCGTASVASAMPGCSPPAREARSASSRIARNPAPPSCANPARRARPKPSRIASLRTDAPPARSARRPTAAPFGCRPARPVRQDVTPIAHRSHASARPARPAFPPFAAGSARDLARPVPWARPDAASCCNRRAPRSSRDSRVSRTRLSCSGSEPPRGDDVAPDALVRGKDGAPRRAARFHWPPATEFATPNFF